VFAGAAAFEPATAQAHYRERLQRLPGLGAAPRAWTVPAQAAWFEALRGTRPALLCTQNLSKLTPAFDSALVQILAASDARLFLFDREGPLSRRYLERLHGCAQREGVVLADRVVLLGARPYAEFLGALQAADLVLDSEWFSGGSTSLDALAQGAPVLAWRGPMARGRQTAGMLELLEVSGLTVDSGEAYAARARELLADATQRADLRQQLRERAPRLFEAEPVHKAFAELLEALANEAR
jgi:predicted O-linked N-acetylglucosamine transferase (SPINDLY family)